MILVHQTAPTAPEREHGGSETAHASIQTDFISQPKVAELIASTGENGRTLLH